MNERIQKLREKMQTSSQDSSLILLPRVSDPEKRFQSPREI